MSVLKKIVRQGFYSLVLACCVILLSAQAPPSKEYQVKAVFLFNFTQFVEWPASAYPAENAPIVIGVLGKNPFSTYLEKVISGEVVKGHPLVVKHFNHVEEVKECHILFINEKDVNKLEQIVLNLKGQNILTVSDADTFMPQGGMVRFITVDKKIKFQINPDAAKAANLNISSKLLSLAQIVVPNKKD